MRTAGVTTDASVIDWLLAGDPAIRWQALRDLLGAPEADWRAERARVETEGWGARLLACQDADGLWAGGAFFPKDFREADLRAEGQPWTATAFALNTLRELGLDPACARARRTIALVGENARWEEGGQAFWSGETEECINGRTLADGAYFGLDMTALAERLLAEVQPDGGWNCERCNGSARSSFASTINVLEGLLAFEAAGAGALAPAVRAARRSAEAFLLERALFRRLSTGEAADPDFLRLAHPNRWRYDILRALDYFRAAALFTGDPPDPRLGEAAERLRERRLAGGAWPCDWRPRGRAWFDMEPADGSPSRWITLKAMRVLAWWDRR